MKSTTKSSKILVHFARTALLLTMLLFGISQCFAQINVDSLEGKTQTKTVKSNIEAIDTLKPISEKSAIVILPQEKRKGFGWKDTVIVPKRSAFYSTLFPGLGQINNRQYWKLPIVYGLMGVGIYFFQDNLRGYNKFQKIYADRKNQILTDEYYPSWSLQKIQGERDYYKKFLDMTVLLTAVGYGLQIMDANVFAHLKGFDISEDISFKVKPSLQPTPFGIASGVGVAFNFK